jgi:hypothetical protein
MASMLKAVLDEDWQKFRDLLQYTTPDEATIQQIAIVGITDPISVLLDCRPLEKYGKKKRSVLHYVASYGNTDQLDILADSVHWEVLRDMKDYEDKTALNQVRVLLEVGQRFDDYKIAEAIKEVENCGFFTPWSHEDSGDLAWEDYLDELREVEKVLAADTSNSDRAAS